MAALLSARLHPFVLILLGLGQVRAEEEISRPQLHYYTLMEDLFQNYKPEVRPTSSGNVTLVFVSISLQSIQGLDEKSQVLESSIIIDAEWNDNYLSWNHSDYGDVSSFLYPQKKVWLPDIIIENSIESHKQLGYDENFVRVDKNGLINWVTSQVIKTGCDIDVTYYPFDIQTCVIMVSTWMSTQAEIQVFPGEDSYGIELNDYTPSGTWEIINNDMELMSNKHKVTRVKFTLTLKRRRMYYILNIILPVIFLSFTASLVFFLPADAGEKIGMGITVLLAYSVYLTIVAENMPQTSLQVSYLAVYLTLLLGLTAMGVVLAVVVLHIHHKSDDCRIGKRTEKVIRNLRVLLRINKVSRETIEESQHHDSSMSKSTQKEPQTHHVARFRTAVTPLNDSAIFSPPPSYQESQEEITWPKVAETVDRAMFLLTSCLIAVMTIVFFPILAHGN